MLPTLTDAPMSETAFVNFIIERDHNTCQYCGVVNPDRFVMEHVIPKMMGGPYQPWNIVFACKSCNHRKGGAVWRPMNLDSITADYPAWREEVLQRAVVPSPASVGIVSKYPPVSYRIDPLVALAVRRRAVELDRQVGDVVTEALMQWLERGTTP